MFKLKEQYNEFIKFWKNTNFKTMNYGEISIIFIIICSIIMAISAINVNIYYTLTNLPYIGYIIIFCGCIFYITQLVWLYIYVPYFM